MKSGGGRSGNLARDGEEKLFGRWGEYAHGSRGKFGRFAG